MTVDGLHIEQKGEGSPIVFTHGFASTGATFAAQTAALAGEHRVVSWDLRGHGGSPAREGDYTREDGLADLAAVVARASEGTPRPVVLVGHSLGGYLTLAHTLAHPETVDGLVLLSTGPGFRSVEKRDHYNRLMEKVAARNGFPLNVAEVVRQKDALVMDGLADIKVPTAVIVGGDDFEMYIGGSRYIAERLPAGEMVEIAGAGHDVHEDRPDEVTAVIRRLVASLP